MEWQSPSVSLEAVQMDAIYFCIMVGSLGLTALFALGCFKL